MATTWRLLQTGSADGPTNMAIDEAVMHVYARGQAWPTLRLYTWSPPCVSIGYFQSMPKEVDTEACCRLGIDVVRRPTGGRAILHEAELTYSLVASVADPAVGGSVLESYQKISAALVEGLRRLGVLAEMAPSRREKAPGGMMGGWRSAACFDAPSDFEVTVGGRKLIGSAQTRKGMALLQHGSILTDFDAGRVFSVLRGPASAPVAELAARLSRRVIALREALGREVALEELCRALTEGFTHALGIALLPGEMTVEEKEVAETLRREKYGAATWNFLR